MPTNHRNRSWRAQWAPDKASGTALHKSGVMARVTASPTDPENNRITLENTEDLDRARWNLSALSKQAGKLWRDGIF